MHDRDIKLNSFKLINTIAVLCGVEELSAQQCAVGAISFCVNLRETATKFAEPITVSRE